MSQNSVSTGKVSINQRKGGSTMTNLQCLEGFLVHSDGARQAFRFAERISVLKKAPPGTQVAFQLFSRPLPVELARDYLCPQGLPIKRHGAGPIFGEHLTGKR